MAQSPDAPLLFDIVEDHVALLRLNRPQARNAIDIETALAIVDAVAKVERDAALRVAVFASATPGMFCAGADLKVVAAGRTAELRPHDAGFAGFVDAVRTKPWIAAVDGLALGGGFEICLACDMIVASPQARFGLPEVKRGLMANGGGAHRVARVLPRNMAIELITSGEPIEAERAAQFGMVNRIAPPEALLEAALDLARLIAGNAPVAVRESLALARMAHDHSDAELRGVSRDRMKMVMSTNDAREGPRAFLEKRKPIWQGK